MEKKPNASVSGGVGESQAATSQSLYRLVLRRSTDPFGRSAFDAANPPLDGQSVSNRQGHN